MQYAPAMKYKTAGTKLKGPPRSTPNIMKGMDRHMIKIPAPFDFALLHLKLAIKFTIATITRTHTRPFRLLRPSLTPDTAAEHMLAHKMPGSDRIKAIVPSTIGAPVFGLTITTTCLLASSLIELSPFASVV
jgi:hypothetical protein